MKATQTNDGPRRDRIVVLLEFEVGTRLRHLAVRRRESLSDLAREGIVRWLESAEREEPGPGYIAGDATRPAA